jgi:hypothetical protein
MTSRRASIARRKPNFSVPRLTTILESLGWESGPFSRESAEAVESTGTAVKGSKMLPANCQRLVTRLGYCV